MKLADTDVNFLTTNAIPISMNDVSTCYVLLWALLTVNRKDEFYSINLLTNLSTEKQKLTSWDLV